MRGVKAYRAVTDSQLVALIAERDGAALVSLYDRYAGACFSLALQMVASEADASQIVHDVYLDVWQASGRSARPAGTGAAEISERLLVATHRRAVEVARRGGRRERGEGRMPEFGSRSARPDQFAPPEVWQAVEAMTAEERQVLALAYFGSYTLQEVAALMRVPLEVVRQRLSSALRALRSSRSSGSSEQAPWTTR